MTEFNVFITTTPTFTPFVHSSVAGTKMTTLKNDVYFAEFKLLSLTAMSICVKSREKKTSIQLAVDSFHARDTSV